ncbi:MAG: O-antigen ligase family protein [Candidatus Omnitrophica bacterium]|nr:O-antigen ligase family protein [Candidatus Omnitrophota bacterium]
MSVLWRAVAPVQAGSLYALLFLLPFSKAAIEVAFGPLLLGWLIERLRPATRGDTLWRRASLRPLAAAVAGFLAACALSIAFSGHPQLSVRGFVGKWLEYLLLMVIAADVASRPRVAQRGVMALIAGSVFVLIEGVTQELFGKGLFRGHLIGWEGGSLYQRMIGPYENPIDLATYLMVVIPILAAFAMSRKGGIRWGLWGLLLSLLLCLARTQARGAWISLAVGGLIVAGWRAAPRRAGMVLAAVALLAGGVLLMRQGRPLGDAVALHDIGTRDRWVMWQAAIGMIRDRPIVGHGVNTFMANYLEYWVGGERMPRYAHNCYLQVAAETGIVGLAAFLWLLAALFLRLGRAARRPPLDASRLLLVGICAGLAAFAVQAAIDTNFYALRQAALFWVLAGMAVGLSEHAAAPQHHRPGL